MLTLPPEITAVLTPFAQVFSRRVCEWAQLLLAGTILAPGKRTVTSVLLVSLPWMVRVWALPFLTVLAPSKKSNEANVSSTALKWF